MIWKRFAIILFPLIFFFLNSLNYSQTISYGDSASLGNGKIKCWIQTSPSGDPEEIGVLITESALTSLPVGGSEFSLDLPMVTNDSLFKHTYIGWNPAGHPPAGIYTLPHFDIHFYLISQMERESITGGPDTTAIPPEFIAPDYIPDPVAIPRMGTHWSDTTSPEFNGEVFTKTLIYGSYQGKFIFYEPMVTVAYLETNPDTLITIKQAAEYRLDGYYPTTYAVRYDQSLQEYQFIIKDFVYRTGTPVSVDNNELSVKGFSLSQNYPNPFNPSTKINYIIPEAGNVKLVVYDVLGNEITTLVNKDQSAGTYEIIFDAKKFTSGVYIYKLTAGSFVQTKKLILIK